MNDKQTIEPAEGKEPGHPPVTTDDKQPRTNTSCGNDPALHRDHRTRLRRRFRDGGADVMAPHELLELMLTYARPRVDTNPTAHRLIERFGSLGGVLSASEDELISVPGVGPETALLIRLFADVRHTANLEDEAESDAPILGTIGDIIRYARPLFRDETKECARLLLLDNGLRLIECRTIAGGTINSVSLSIREAVETCLFKRASSVVLVHNHPNGLPTPSAADLEMTRRLQSVLDTIGIELKEHVILSPRDSVAILHNRRYLHTPETEK